MGCESYYKSRWFPILGTTSVGLLILLSSLVILMPMPESTRATDNNLMLIRSLPTLGAEIPGQSTPTAGTPIPAGSPNTAWTPVMQEFDGVEMVLVPAGCFMMGSTDEQIDAVFQQCESERGAGKCERSWFDEEKPAHEVCLDEPFWIDRTEVTNAQFTSFGGQAESDSQWSGDNLPREETTQFETSSFCEMRGGRLPTEAEWEYAARGPEGWIYPWGNEFVADNVVYGVNSGYQTAEVGSKPGGASWVGAQDLGGNAWEWVSDWYAPYSSDPQTNPTGPSSGDLEVLRGGSAFDYSYGVHAAYRSDWGPVIWNFIRGFRCVRSAEG